MKAHQDSQRLNIRARAMLDQTQENGKETDFYRLWTLNEAWYKAGTQGSFSDIPSELDFSTPATWELVRFIRTRPQFTRGQPI